MPPSPILSDQGRTRNGQSDPPDSSTPGSSAPGGELMLVAGARGRPGLATTVDAGSKQPAAGKTRPVSSTGTRSKAPPPKNGRAKADLQEGEVDDADFHVSMIEHYQRYIHDHAEGTIVRSLIKLGSHLVALEAASGKARRQQLEELGIRPRLARQLQAAGKAWAADVEGDSQSARVFANHLIPKLPPDPNKLALLSRLDAEQLKVLIGRLDLKKISRKQTAEEVRSALGEGPRPVKVIGGGGAIKSIERQFVRMAERLERLLRTASDAGLEDRIRDTVAAGITRLTTALGQATDDRGRDDTD
jgi:hypothetical protein